MIACPIWRNFDEIEEALTLDELLLLIDRIAERDKIQFKMNAAIHGVEVDDTEDQPDNPLPPEVQAMEEEFAKKKAQLEAETGRKMPNPLGDIGLGLTTIADQLDQLE